MYCSIRLQKLWKSVDPRQSYERRQSWPFLSRHRVPSPAILEPPLLKVEFPAIPPWIGPCETAGRRIAEYSGPAAAAARRILDRESAINSLGDSSAAPALLCLASHIIHANSVHATQPALPVAATLLSDSDAPFSRQFDKYSILQSSAVS